MITVSAASSNQRRPKFFSCPSALAISAGTRSDIIRSISTWLSGIAEAGIVFDQLRAVLGDHHPGIEHALVGRAHAFSARSVGSIISSITRAHIASVMTGAGE